METGRVARSVGQPLPELFGEERHGGMEQAQRGLERGQSVAPVGVEAGVFLEAELLQLDVPVAELVPEEMPEHLRGFVVAVLLDGAIHLLGAAVQAAEDPAVFDRHLERVGRARAELLEASGTQGSTPERSIFMKRKRAAFQILLAKARELSMRSSVSTMSVPGAAPAAAPCGRRRCRTAR